MLSFILHWVQCVGGTKREWCSESSGESVGVLHPRLHCKDRHLSPLPWIQNPIHQRESWKLGSAMLCNISLVIRFLPTVHRDYSDEINASDFPGRIMFHCNGNYEYLVERSSLDYDKRWLLWAAVAKKIVEGRSEERNWNPRHLWKFHQLSLVTFKSIRTSWPIINRVSFKPSLET